MVRMLGGTVSLTVRITPSLVLLVLLRYRGRPWKRRTIAAPAAALAAAAATSTAAVVVAVAVAVAVAKAHGRRSNPQRSP